MSDSQIHLLYLLACLVSCGLSVALLGYVFIKVYNARLAKRPGRTVVSALGPHSPTRRQRKAYWRAMRKDPGALTYTLPATAPRAWTVAGSLLILATIAVWAVLMPDPARFNVMVRSTVGYDANVAEVHIVQHQHEALLHRWAPVVVRNGRYIAVPRYSRGPFRHLIGYNAAVLPAQVRQQGDVLQVAMARVEDAAVLRRQLATASGLPEQAIHMQRRDVAPWRERGWEPWPVAGEAPDPEPQH